MRFALDRALDLNYHSHDDDLFHISDELPRLQKVPPDVTNDPQHHYFLIASQHSEAQTSSSHSDIVWSNVSKPSKAV